MKMKSINIECSTILDITTVSVSLHFKCYIAAQATPKLAPNWVITFQPFE